MSKQEYEIATEKVLKAVALCAIIGFLITATQGGYDAWAVSIETIYTGLRGDDIPPFLGLLLSSLTLIVLFGPLFSGLLVAYLVVRLLFSATYDLVGGFDKPQEGVEPTYAYFFALVIALSSLSTLLLAIIVFSQN